MDQYELKDVSFNSIKLSSPRVEQFVDELVELDSENKTWLKKLEFVSNLMEKYKDEVKEFPTFKSEGIAILSAYLYFINTG